MTELLQAGIAPALQAVLSVQHRTPAIARRECATFKVASSAKSPLKRPCLAQPWPETDMLVARLNFGLAEPADPPAGE